MADKKILEDELLSDEELDQVAGGAKWETDQLEDLYRSYCYSKGESSFLMSNGIIEGFLYDAGITSSINNTFDKYYYDTKYESEVSNSYSMNGKSMTHEQVVKHLKEFYKLG